VLFAYDTVMNLLGSVALVNTGFSNPMDVDRLATPEALDLFLAEHAYSYIPKATPALVAEIRALRQPMHDLFTSSRDDAVEVINRWLADAEAVPRLVRHDQLDWHIHAERPGATLATQILVETAMGMIDVVRADEMGRLSVCEDDACEGIVLDLSKNRSRRYCSTACGNRAAVAAYRARRAT
jgi:predicted RNA-binding Zn ribbon-like protein